MTVRFGSVCSGIEAASVAFAPLGWQAAWLSEIEPFPCAVLAHHYPDVPNLGDMTKLPARIATGEVDAPDVFCGGTPCQAFSVAGLRKSLDDARGNLSLVFCEIANAIDTARAAQGKPPAVVFWENVPGVLNTKDNAFGCFLGALAGEDAPLVATGGRWTNAGCVFGPQRAVAWRVLDAQYFGVAQRRRRVFVVASARSGFDPAAVLFEFGGVRRDTAPSRETGQTATAGTLRSSDGGSDVDHARGNQLVRVEAFTQNQRDEVRILEVAGALAAEPGMKQQTYLQTAMQVRRLTPRECERLQGFPDDYTLIPWTEYKRIAKAAEKAGVSFESEIKKRGKVLRTTVDDCPDGPRYKALGNSWAVPCARWIGRRIDAQLQQCVML